MKMKSILATALVFILSTVVMAEQNVVIVLDDSGSMNDPMRKNGKVLRINAAKTALHTVVNQISPDTKVGIVLLNKGWIVPLSKINKVDLNNKIDSIVPAGGTELGKSMKIGADALLTVRAKEGVGVYKLLIVTDGEESDTALVNKYLPDMIRKRITVDVIGVDMKGNHSLATKVNQGRYKSADDVKAITAAISNVFAESTGGADDIGDYEVIAAIPDEIAKSAIMALTHTDNTLIGEKPKTASAKARARASVVTGQETIEGMGVGWWVIIIMGSIIGMIAIVLIGKEIGLIS